MAHYYVALLINHLIFKSGSIWKPMEAQLVLVKHQQNHNSEKKSIDHFGKGVYHSDLKRKKYI